MAEFWVGLVTGFAFGFVICAVLAVTLDNRRRGDGRG